MGKFGKLSVARQTQILLFNGILKAKIYPFVKLFLPTIFNLAIHQTFLLYDIRNVYCIITCDIFLIGNEFFITDNSMITLPLRANDVKHDNNDDNKKAVSQHSFKHLSLNSLFLQSLGDQDGIAPMVVIHLLAIY